MKGFLRGTTSVTAQKKGVFREFIERKVLHRMF